MHLAWAGELKQGLGEIKHAVNMAKAYHPTALEPAQITRYTQCYEAILQADAAEE